MQRIDDTGTNIEVGTGIARQDDARAAGENAAQQALQSIRQHRLSAVLVFASVRYDLDELLRGIHGVVGNVPVLGASTAGEICNGVHQGSVVLMALASPHLSVRVGLGHGVSADWRGAIDQAITAQPLLPFFSPDDTSHWHEITRQGSSVFGLLFSPGNTRNADSRSWEITEELKRRSLNRIPIFGGSAADDWRMEDNFVFCNGRAHSDSVLLAVFETRLRFGTAVAHGFHPESRIVRVTRASGHDILELDGQPAIRRYAELTGVPEDVLRRQHLTLATGKPLGSPNPFGEYTINVASYATADGGIRVAQPVVEGQTLVAMQGRPEEMIVAGQQAVRKAILRANTARPAAILACSCALRTRVLGDRSADEISQLMGLVPHAPVVGFYGFGEQGTADDGTNCHNNEAFTALVLGHELSVAAELAMESLVRERKNSRILDCMEDVYAEVSVEDGTVLEISPSIEAVAGYSREEVLGKPMAQFYACPEQRSALLAVLFEQGAVRDYEVLLANKAGQQVPCSFSVRLIRTEDGRPERIVGTLRDITARKQAEGALQTLSQAVEYTSAAIVITGVDGTIEYVNPTFERLTGYTREELIGNNPRILKSGRQPLSLYQELWNAITSGRQWQGRLQNRRKDGRLYWEQAKISPITNNHGEITRFVAVKEDITAKVAAEEETQQRLERARRQRAAMHRFVREPSIISGNVDRGLPAIGRIATDAMQVTHVSMWLLNRDESTLECCWRCDSPLDVSEAQDALPVADFPQLLAILNGEGVVDVQDARTDPRVRELTATHLDPREITSLLIAPIRRSGKLAGTLFFEHIGQERAWAPSEIAFAGQVADQVVQLLGNAQRIRAEQCLKDNVKALESVNATLEEASRTAESGTRAKSEFLANMSHEIRTPMTAIMGFADILLSEAGLDRAPPARVEALRTIQRNGQYLLELINDILDLSKIEAGRLDVECSRCNPLELVRDVARLMQVRADAKRIALSVEYVSPIPETIRTDSTRLRQILINLIGNAIKFTEIGTVRLVTRFLHANGKPPSMQFEVIDTGIGMSQEQQSRLFQPFTQGAVSISRKYGGTGLGLAISRRLAEKLGGNIAVNSTLGKGSTFTLTTNTGPVEGVRMLDEIARAAFDQKIDCAATQNDYTELGGKILLAEDGADNQRLIAFLLKKAGAEVTLAVNGKEACDKAMAARAGGDPFDVILMDMQMPVMDGYEASRRLRAAGYDGPIVALTANAMEGDEQACRQSGCDGYATKPIDRNKLLATVVEFLRSRNAPRPNAGMPADSDPTTPQQPDERLQTRVLLAEDTPDIQSLIAALLKACGAMVTVADNGQVAAEEALTAQRAGQPFDLILMDMQMPVMDGYDSTKRLRQEGYRGRIVALTAYAMRGDREKCLAAGCDDYLTKPIDPDRLGTLLKDSAGARPVQSGSPCLSPRGTPNPAVDKVLTSQYADRPVVARMLGDFVSRLDARVQAIQHALSGSRSDELRRLAHQLKGAAGSYGYPSVSAAAKILEDQARQGQLDAAARTTAHIAVLCHAVLRGWKPQQQPDNTAGSTPFSTTPALTEPQLLTQQRTPR